MSQYITQRISVVIQKNTALKQSTKLATDIISGSNVKDSLKRRAQEAKDEIAQSVVKAIKGGGEENNSSKRKKKKKVISTKRRTKKDIFET